MELDSNTDWSILVPNDFSLDVYFLVVAIKENYKDTSLRDKIFQKYENKKFILLLTHHAVESNRMNLNDYQLTISKSLEAIFLRILLIILPDLVFGKPAVMCIKSGVAIGPIFSLIVFFKSNSKLSDDSTPTFKET